MKIDKIILNNFRQYSGINEIDLRTGNGKNIILIGGKNGYGKTNLLLSLVWCLYGDEIAKIDEYFRREIQKDGNYSKFLKGSLNWDNQRKGQTSFSVEIQFSDIELPDSTEIQAIGKQICKIKREFDVSEATDTFDISIDGARKSIFTNQEDKVNFINDYLIPLEAAKFVFFDAEKIASWAELSTKEEGNILNDALGKILGLDVFDSLIADLNTYTDSLRKESAAASTRQQIFSNEGGIAVNREKIDEIERLVLEKDAEIQKIRTDISQYEAFLIRHGNKPINVSGIEELYRQRENLQLKEREFEARFGELAEIMPFAIAAGKLEEVVEHLNKQDTRTLLKDQQTELLSKATDLVEQLFNAPPFPGDGDISFSKKIFYADKAKKIVESIFGTDESTNDLPFEHDLAKADRELLVEAYNHVQKQSGEVFEQVFEGFEKLRTDIEEVDKIITRVEADLEDEEIIEYTNKKKEAERRIEKATEEKGALLNQKDSLRKTIDKLSQDLQILLKKVSVSELKGKKLEQANLYIRALENFVMDQKRNKCQFLEDSIFSEMKKLMHKLNQNNYQDFIAAVKAETLPDNDGLKITLYNSNGQVRAKESLSQGEKQLYISSLIKAILALSIQEYPIFIDTPLGRMDDDHIKQILLYYYPDLASQVILMATNNEIPPSRFKMMQNNIAKAYLLEHSDNKTKFKEGYFKSYEN